MLKRRCRSTRIPTLLPHTSRRCRDCVGAVAVVLGLGVSTAIADDGPIRNGSTHTESVASHDRLISGRAVNESVPSFYTRAVTGPLANKSVCYVCRNGSRPVVMLLMRRMDPELKPLLKQVSRIVDRNRAAGLRGFGVLISSDAVKATSKVQTFAFNNKVTIPLTVGGEGIGYEACQNVHAEAAVTVVLYRRQRVVDRFAFREGELSSSRVKTIVDRVKRFVADGE